MTIFWIFANIKVILNVSIFLWDNVSIVILLKRDFIL